MDLGVIWVLFTRPQTQFTVITRTRNSKDFGPQSVGAVEYIDWISAEGARAHQRLFLIWHWKTWWWGSSNAEALGIRSSLHCHCSPGLLCHRVIAPDRVPSMAEIEQTRCFVCKEMTDVKFWLCYNTWNPFTVCKKRS